MSTEEVSQDEHGMYRCLLTLLFEDVTEAIAREVFAEGTELHIRASDGLEYDLSIDSVHGWERA